METNISKHCSLSEFDKNKNTTNIFSSNIQKSDIAVFNNNETGQNKLTDFQYLNNI